jgi:predicted permease
MKRANMPDWKPEIRRRLANLQLAPTRETAIVEELAQHLDDYYAELRAGGATEAEAERRTLAELSEREMLRRELRRVERRAAPEPIILGTDRRTNMLADLWQDLRFGARMLLKNPGITLIVVVTLALGIGANSAIFSVVNAVLLSPLPYGQPDRLVALYSENAKRGLTQQPVAYANFKDWREQNQTFEQIAALRSETQVLTGSGEPERISGVRVTPNILPLLGVQPVVGRDFLPEEEQPEKAAVALIGYGLWQRRFGGAPNVIGQAITFNGRPYTIIGVLPAWLKYPGLTIPATGAEIWLPLVPSLNESNRRVALMRVIGKLKSGVSRAQAQADLAVLAARQEREYPEINTNVGVEVKALHEVLTGRVQLGLWVLLGAVGMVLLIACVNVANLLLARAAGRQTELAIRTALGADRWRVIRQLLTECLLLSLGGCLLGVLLAYQGVGWLTRTNAGNLPRVEEISVNGRVLGFTLLLSLLTTLLCGLLPALRSTRINLGAALKEGGKGGLGNALNRHWLNGLIVTEMALALVLLVGAGLLIRSFRAVTEVNPGFNLHNLLTLAVPLPQAGYRDQAAQLRYYENALARLNAVPGVRAAAVSRLPMVGLAGVTFTIEGKPVQLDAKPDADYFAISPNYLRTIGLPLLQGREFSEYDTANTSNVIIINEELARRYWPGENPIGKRLHLTMQMTGWREVVGLVADARMSGLEAKIEPAIYLPLAQNWWADALRSSFLVVRTQAEPHSLLPSLRETLREIDSTLPITQVRTMEEIVDRSLAQRRFNMALLLGFATLAAVLAAVGIYGVMSYSILQRRNEIGVRLALGGQPSDILKLVIRDSAKLTGVGILLGLAGAFGLTRLMSSLLFGVQATDPLTYFGVALLLAMVALLACYLPARRAAKVDPLVALRGE